MNKQVNRKTKGETDVSPTAAYLPRLGLTSTKSEELP